MSDTLSSETTCTFKGESLIYVLVHISTYSALDLVQLPSFFTSHNLNILL